MTATPLARLRDWAMTPRGAALSALFLMLLAFLPGQATIAPIDRDEPRFAQATRQMLETGDFIDIRYLDKPRHLQPAGIYWIQAGAVAVFGEEGVREIWPHRIPSWLSAIATTFMTWWLGGLLFGRNAGRIAGALMGSALILNAEARFAKIDATLCAATLAAQAALARLYMARERAETLNWRWPALFWSALGVAILLKGPIVLVVTGGTVLALLLLERRARWLQTLKPLWGVPLMLAIAAPWYIAIAVATDGAFYKTALGYSVAGKIAGSHQKHGGPFGYHLALFSATFWPGSLFAWLAAPFVWARRADPAVRFCIAWILPAWLVFELSGTKLPHYTLPLLPAIAMLSAAAIGSAQKTPLFGRPILYSIVTVLWILLSAVIAFGPPVARLHLQQDSAGLSVALAALVFTCAVLAAIFGGAGNARSSVVAAVAAGVLASVNTFGLSAPALSSIFMSPRIAADVAKAKTCPRATMVLLGYHEPSLVFLLGQGVRLAGSAEEARKLVAAAPECAVFVAQGPQAAAALDALTQDGAAPTLTSTVSGANINESGDDQAISIYRVAAKAAP